jgi:hypothetical protein
VEKSYVGKKLRIRVFSWVFPLFFTHTTKGASIQLYLGIGVERVKSLSIWLFFGKVARVLTYVLSYGQKAVNPD